jgi:hypothetical protein
VRVEVLAGMYGGISAYPVDVRWRELHQKYLSLTEGWGTMVSNLSPPERNAPMVRLDEVRPRVESTTACGQWPIGNALYPALLSREEISW